MAGQHVGERALDGDLTTAVVAVAGRLRNSSRRIAASSPGRADAADASAAAPSPPPPPAAAAASPSGPATPAAALARPAPRRGRSAEPSPANDDGDDDVDADLNKRRRCFAFGSGSAAPPPPPLPSPLSPPSRGPPVGIAPKLGCGRPLRLIILGHNPSEVAWQTGHFYGHGSNKMWPLLRRVGISPPGTPPGPADDLLPAAAGVGFLDVGTGVPGTHSSAFSSADFARWRPAFYARLRAHIARASARLAGEEGEEEGGGGGGCTCGACGAPLAVAFAGKRQFQELLALPPMLEPEAEAAAAAVKEEEDGAFAAAGGDDGGGAVAAAANKRKGKKKPKSKGANKTNRLPPVALGLQTELPHGWPLPPSTQVWVTATTSGAAGLTDAAREASWREMWAAVGREPWPRRVAAACARGAGAGGMAVKKEEEEGEAEVAANEEEGDGAAVMEGAGGGGSAGA